MRAIVFCNSGIEEFCALEIKEIIGKESEQFGSYLTFDCNEGELCKVCYLGQSISKGVLLLEEFEFKSEEDIIKKASSLKCNYFSDDKSFMVDAKIINSEINKEVIKGAVGQEIKGSSGMGVNLEGPDLIVYVFVDSNKCFMGVEFSGMDLAKRNYRIFSSPGNIKSTIAYSMVRFSGYEKGELLLDPFCMSGSVVIECALYRNNYPVRFFEREELKFKELVEFNFEEIDNAKKEENNIHALDAQFRNVDSSRKNAKIAGINKAINFSRKEVEWLDTKFDENSVDRIVTCVPVIGKHTDINFIMKLYNEFFHQAEFVLKKEGRIVICTKNPEEVLECAGKFSMDEKREVYQGKEKYWFLKLKKSK